MRILKIAGRNLASLAGEFCVDFEAEPLASSGLFAISGPTGAGKSTLLDAMCLALYDATPRLLKRKNADQLPDVGNDRVSVHDPRTLLRRGAAEGWAEVDFVGNDGLRYRSRWSIRRSYNKSSGGLQKAQMSLKLLPGLNAIGGTNTEVLQEIVNRVGLQFEQFTRAVLLAQNEFSAFLKTEENERGELLETLTGTDIYSELSKRAFERFKAEQAAMQRLAARLADQTPMVAEARLELEAQAATADAALHQLDERKATLEQQLRWQQEADKLRNQVAAAEIAVTKAAQAVLDAAPRKRRLAAIDAVQPARPIVADNKRIAAEASAVAASIAAGNDAVAKAVAEQEAAAQALADTGARLNQAEDARKAAAPALDAAKALDATIATLKPANAGAAQARDAAAHERQAAAAALAAASDRLASLKAAQEQDASWLASHRGLEALATQWPRWDKLLGQAAQQAVREQAATADTVQASSALDAATAAEATAAAALLETASRLQALEAARQQAITALAAFDSARLREERQALDARRDSLAGAEKLWSALDEGRMRVRQADARTGELEAEAATAAALAGQAAGAQDALDAARVQAERSLEAAQLACAGSVTDLRSTLRDGVPCPVCGSGEHPYHHQGDRLHAMLASLQAEAARCRGAAADNLAVHGAQRALLAANEKQLATARLERQALSDAMAAAETAWATHPLSHESALDAGWLAGQHDMLRNASRALDEREQAERTAAASRDTAQAACDHASAERERAQEASASARTALAEARNHNASVQERRSQAATALAATLDELDGAFDGGWRDKWNADPDQFRASSETGAAAWNTRSRAQAERAVAIVALDAERTALQARDGQAASASEATRQAFGRIDAELAARQRERAALWDGKAVGDIEAGLQSAVDAARQLAASQQAAREAASHAETRARESLAHNKDRHAALEKELDAAASRLDGWIAGFGEQHPALDAMDQESLMHLLAVDAGWIAGERSALAALDSSTSSAQTVLAERRTQAGLHAQHGPGENAIAPELLADALAALLAERKLAHDTATALRLQVAQDNVRRENAQSVMAEIEAQQLVERRWGQMNELIGSSDGKKFRNYAQQFTLDVLLGYANSHLAQLAKRYRLERVAGAGGPSLGLLVRDQDMGGEIRSVNSLSGGESFLVSLALALGLASLSSNRVRVESLFIDEGFGSLDSDTLRVAMDALDGLQSMGRKVGVISHVQEMTERISTRVLVLPAGGGTSSVSVQ